MAFSIVCLPSHLSFLSLLTYPWGFFSLPVFLTIMPEIFIHIYKEAPGIAGLHYIALGIGLALGCYFNALLMDRIYIHYKNKNGVGEPEFRLRELIILSSYSFPDAVLIDSPTSLSDNDPCKYYPSRWTDTFRMGGTT